MEIRRAINNDIDRLLDLLSQVLEVHAKIRPDIFKSGTRKYNREQLIEKVDDDKSPIYVATIDNYVVGYAFCKIRLPEESNTALNKVCYIDDLCVDAKYTHQGIGESLFNYVKKEAKRLGCYEITLNAWVGNTPANEFYKKMGMKPYSVNLEYILDKEEKE